ncbi:hypothetical protein CDAR_251261 [Caerostris darwini]|uniref:Uncharacterized protein n=1 Tax=Caerostris darwini TaxID=1538125 RepID=A0AAV4RAG7_9ARAC|nr:hypothetical protein CDAR_251261 [Caerostris darwini]
MLNSKKPPSARSLTRSLLSDHFYLLTHSLRQFRSNMCEIGPISPMTFTTEPPWMIHGRGSPFKETRLPINSLEGRESPRVTCPSSCETLSLCNENFLFRTREARVGGSAYELEMPSALGFG